jgi:hypothetical protein
MRHRTTFWLLIQFLLSSLIFLPSAQAQLVNFEDTWQEFLKKEKTSNISKLVKPEKSQPANYIKFCLMYSNSYFCADNLESSEKMISEIETMGKEIQEKVPGFVERFESLKVKIKSYHDLTPYWNKFMTDKSTVSRKDLASVPDAKTVCEKGTLCKFFYMTAHAYYCEGNLEKSKERFENRVLKLAATTFDPKVIDGMNEEIEMMKELWEGISKLDVAWETYMLTKVSPGFETDIPVIDCYTIPWMKIYVLRAATDICKYGNEMLEKIHLLKEKNSHDIPEDLAEKIKWLEEHVQQNNTELAVLNEAWNQFIPEDKLTENRKYGHTFSCDREAEIKAYIMDGMLNPCTFATNALDSIAGIRKRHHPSLGEITSLKLIRLKAIVSREIENVATLNKAWEDFVPDDKLNGPIKFVFEYCDKIAQTKAYIIDGTINLCLKGQQRLDDIEKLRDEYNPGLDETTINKIDKLQYMIDKIDIELSNLNTVWKDFVDDEQLTKKIKYEHIFPCNREAEVRAWTIDGLLNPCKDGENALKNINRIQKDYQPELDDKTKEKLKKLQKIVGTENDNLATLNKAWADFLPDNKLSEAAEFVFEYCDKAAQIRAYTIDGSINFCAKARQRLVDIYSVRQEHDPELNKETKDKIDRLQAAVNKSDNQLEDLNKAWSLYVATDTTTIWRGGFPAKDKIIRDQIKLVNFYCDKIAQTKSWIIKGHLDPCEKGENYLKKAASLKAKHQLQYDEELICQIHRLSGKVYQCKYWALVLEARRITHEERERFGPVSAKIMYTDLNSSKSNCETTVIYEPLGNIGIKYIIAPHLCSKANLAKMGDPAYYKKIASWVDQEVLSKYCEVSMRCKEDFFIYLEGHTDGYRFNGRSYPHPIDIPEGTPFTHFLGKDTLQTATRNITSTLKNNMELGVARAWSVRAQLKFMNVPITIGAFEHPEEEKGGEYRRIDIELNITNLLLDFYEKTLVRLVKESRIGARPPADC